MAVAPGGLLARVAVVGVAGLPDLELEPGPVAALFGADRGSGKSQILSSIAWLMAGRGGSRDPIVLLGRGTDPFLSIRIRPRRRIAAIGVGMAVSLTGAIVSALLLETADATTYAHAVVTLALGVNVALVAGAFVLAPGFLGWTLLLSLVDAAGSEPDQRVRRAARLARSIGFPMLLLAGVAVLLPALGRHGFAIVTATEALGHVEASDLLETIQAWVAEDRRPPDPHRASR